MKRTVFSICLILLISGMAKAQSVETIYKNLPVVTTEQLIHFDSNEAALDRARTQMNAAQEKINNVMVADGTERQNAQQQTLQKAKQNKPTEAQMQASRAIGGDIMAALAAAGISPEKMATMSEEELAAIVMPMVAQKTGLSPQEMAAMQGMTDAQAEAYMRQGNRAQRVQNSEYGKYANDMKDMHVGMDITEEDYAKIDMIIDLVTKVEDQDVMVNAGNSYMQFNETAFKQEMDQLYTEKYEPRINAILDELYKRIENEPAWKTSNGNGIPMPAYGKDYYARVNAIVDEYNKDVITRWDNAFGKDLKNIDAELQKNFELNRQVDRIYQSLSTPDAKNMARQHMSQNAVCSLANTYINLQLRRLEVNRRAHYSVPEVVGGMG